MKETNENRPLIFVGHSRGGVKCVLAAWFIYLYAPVEKYKRTPISIFVIDPVPGPTRKGKEAEGLSNSAIVTFIGC